MKSTVCRGISFVIFILFSYLNMIPAYHSTSRLSRTFLRPNFNRRRSAQFASSSSIVQMPTSSTFHHSDKAKIIFVLGGPGAGKGTQCEKFSSEFGITHLSAGELLRKEIQTGSAQGQLIDSYLKDGRIVPVEMSLSLLRREIQLLGHQRYLIDGFPRNSDNLQGWLKLMPSVCDIEFVIFLECNEQELERRILERGRTSNRSDDNLKTAKKRFATFQSETLPVVEYFAQNSSGFPLIRIDGSKSVDAVYDDMKSSFIPFLRNDLLHLSRSIIENQYKNYDIVKDETVEMSGLTGAYSCALSNAGQEHISFKKEWTLCHGSWKSS